MYRKSQLESLSQEVLLMVARQLDYLSLIRLGAASRRFHTVLNDDMLFKELLVLDYGVSYKSPDETWKEQYQQKWSDTSGRRICPHLSSVTDDILLEKAETFKSAQESSASCSKCSMSQFPNLMLVMEEMEKDVLCRHCLSDYINERKAQGSNLGIYLDMSTLRLRCFLCRMRRTPLGGFGSDRSEQYKCELILEVLIAGTDAGKEKVDLILKRKKEREMYVGQQDELANTPFKQVKCNLVDAQWMGRFHLFIYGGYPSPGRITNRTLIRRNGNVIPDLKLYGEDVALVTETFWNHLAQEYGVDGRAVTEDDLQGKDYASLRQKITLMKRKMCNQAKNEAEKS
ncbi:unnamed protein product [Umbelopsis sp. WA50703]